MVTFGSGRRTEAYGPGIWERREDRSCSQDSVESEAFVGVPCHLFLLFFVLPLSVLQPRLLFSLRSQSWKWQLGCKCCIFVKSGMETFFGWRCPWTWNESDSHWNELDGIQSDLYPQDLHLWRWLSDDTERSLPLKVEFPTHILKENGECHTTQGHRGGKHQHLVRRQKQEWGESLARAFPGLSVAKIGQGRLGVSGLNSSGGLWATGVVSGCLVPGPEMV